MSDLSLTLSDDGVAALTVHRGPHNFFDRDLITRIADQVQECAENEKCRVILFSAEGKNFSAGAQLAQLGSNTAPSLRDQRHTYHEAVRILSGTKPIVAAVQGGAIGGGFGLALVADFRVVTPASYFLANFTELGLHPGFGTTATLPRVVGAQKAAELFLTSQKVPGEEAVRIGLADRLAPEEELGQVALDFARRIAEMAPHVVTSTRETLRRGLVDAVRSATEREMAEQAWLMKSQDYAEGLRAAKERRKAVFTGN